MVNPTMKFDKPASVTWSTPEPDGKPMPANKREFATLREAIGYVRRMGHGARAKMTVRSGGRRYDAADIDAFEREMRRR